MFVLYLFTIFAFVQCGSAVIHNFKVVGELVSDKVESCDTANLVSNASYYFEEYYYANTETNVNRSLVRLTSRYVKDGKPLQYVTIWDHNQKTYFSIFTDEANNLVCDAYTMEAELMSFESTIAPYFLILSELQSHLSTDGEEIIERGRPADKFKMDLSDKGSVFGVKNAEVTFDGQETDDKNSTDNDLILSGSFCIKSNNSENETIDIKSTWEKYSFIMYTVNTTTEEDVSPPEGLSCPTFGNSSIPFKFQDISSLVFKTEFHSDQPKVLWHDIIMNFNKNYSRIDSHDGTSYFISSKQGVVYEMQDYVHNQGHSTCQVKSVDKITRLEGSPIDFKPKTPQQLLAFLDNKEENFRVIKQTKRRGINCLLIGGIREDYPWSSAEVLQSYWEYCIAPTDQPNKYVVHVDVYLQAEDCALQYCLRESYSLFDVMVLPDNDLYQTYMTDIGSCFADDNTLALQVAIDVQNKPDKASLTDIISTIGFKSAFSMKLNEMAGLDESSFRLHIIQVIPNGDSADLQFTVLGIHPDLTEDVRSQEPSLDKVKSNLEDKINNSPSPVEINGVEFIIRKNSLIPIEDMEPTTDTPSSTTSSTPDPSSTTTEANTPDDPQGGASVTTFALSAVFTFIFGIIIGGAVSYKFINFN